MGIKNLFNVLLKLFGIDKRNDKASLHDNQFPHSISTGKHQDLVKNLELLVDEGNYAACYDLGQLYYHGGNGMEKDIRKAILYFIKAADNGIPEAAYQLGKIYETGVENVLAADQRLSFEWYTRAAEACIPEAENNLGSCYFFGRGVDVDYDRAFCLYSSAAKKGNIEAEMNVGICYAAGRGVEQDYTLAYRWWKKAAENGHVKAMVNLATCYEMGVGIAQNKLEAYRWYKNAAELGDVFAANKLIHQ